MRKMKTSVIAPLFCLFAIIAASCGDDEVTINDPCAVAFSNAANAAAAFEADSTNPILCVAAKSAVQTWLDDCETLIDPATDSLFQIILLSIDCDDL